MIPEPFVVSYISEKTAIIKRIKELLQKGNFDGIIVGTDSDTEGKMCIRDSVDTLPPKDTQNTETDNHTSAAN